MNIAIDTNVLYYLYGRKKLDQKDTDEKINGLRLNTIINNNDVYITSVTLVEIMTHFQSKPPIIKNLFEYIILHNFSIISVGVSDISYDKLVTLSNASDQEIRLETKRVLKEKIETESFYATIILILELEQYYYYYFEKTRLINQSFKQYSLDLQISTRDMLIDKFITYNLYLEVKKKFKHILKIGYASEYSDNKSQMAIKLLKQAFDEVLKHECVNFVFVLNLMVDSNFKFDFDDLLNNWSKFKTMQEPYYQLALDQISAHDDLDKLCGTNDNINSCIRELLTKFGKRFDTDFYKNYKSVTIQETFKPIESKMPVEYIGKIMDRWGVRGSKFEKNDILDMFILRVLKMDKFVLITFDKMMQDYIHETHHISDEYINRVYNR